MSDVIITGASRGIGRALAQAHARTQPGDRLLLVARDGAALAGLVAEIGSQALAVPGDLSTIAGAKAIAAVLLAQVKPGATLVHNAGVWPSTRVRTVDQLETAFAVNFAGPLAMQAPLLVKKRLKRVMVVSAGLIAQGRFDAVQTPGGDDFSQVFTYCSTKLAFAVQMKEIARLQPELDVVALHPGVVRTGLGQRRGPIGWVMGLVKRTWESPEDCAFRLEGFLAQATRWSPPGEAQWYFEKTQQPWPQVARAEKTRVEVAKAVVALGLVDITSFDP